MKSVGGDVRTILTVSWVLKSAMVEQSLSSGKDKLTKKEVLSKAYEAIATIMLISTCTNCLYL